MTEKDDRLPDFFSTEPLPPQNAVCDVPDAEFEPVCAWSPVIEVGWWRGRVPLKLDLTGKAS